LEFYSSWLPGGWQPPAIVFNQGTSMENILAALVSVALAVYLLYALLRPEKF
jgi:K+-transporting ATPase KdpF subunit